MVKCGGSVMELRRNDKGQLIAKAFISQPMTGYSDETIELVRATIVQRLEKDFSGVEFQIIDSILKDPDDERPIFNLGRSLAMMSEADIVVFAPGYEKSRGCVVEHCCAQQYGLLCYYITE
jgi:hypothetical protein